MQFSIHKIINSTTFCILISCLLITTIWIVVIKLNQIENTIHDMKKELKYISSRSTTPILHDVKFINFGQHIIKIIPYQITFSEDLDYFSRSKKDASPHLSIKPYYLKKNKEIEFHPKQWGSRLLALGFYTDRENALNETDKIIK